MIAQSLIQGKKPAEIISDPELDDAVRQAAGETFSLLSELDLDNAAVIAGDCMRNMQIQRIQQEIQSMTDLMRTAETPQKRADALKEVSELSKELARLKQQGR